MRDGERERERGGGAQEREGASTSLGPAFFPASAGFCSYHVAIFLSLVRKREGEGVEEGERVGATKEEDEEDEMNKRMREGGGGEKKGEATHAASETQKGEWSLRVLLASWDA